MNEPWDDSELQPLTPRERTLRAVLFVSQGVIWLAFIALCIRWLV